MNAVHNIMQDMPADTSKYLTQISAQQLLRERELIHLVEINSSSLNPQGINAVGEWFEHKFSAISQTSERIHLPTWQRMGFDGDIQQQPLGDLWRFKQRPQAKYQILLTGHLDTVFPIDSTFNKAVKLDQMRLNAPGAADMKGGLLVMLAALECLENTPYAHQLGWTVILNPDEEIGSPQSANYLEHEAKQHDIGLIYEPALPDGNLAGERKGSGNFSCTVRGRAAHAGREPEKGRNAINKAAELILELAQLNSARRGLTLNTGMIQSGETTNKVPDLAVFKFNIRIEQPNDASWCKQQIVQLINKHNQTEGYNISLHGEFGRMPKVMDSSHHALYTLLQQCSQKLGTPLNWQATGGCCDGNNLSAAGLPNIDTLGVRGNFIHSHNEIIELPSLTDRAQLSTLLLLYIATNGLPFSHQHSKPRG